MKAIMKFINKFYLPFMLFTILTVVLGLLFIFLFPFHVGEIKKITIINQVESGGTINYKTNYCRNVGESVPTEVRRFLVPVDSKDNLQPIELSSRPSIESTRAKPGCRESKNPIVIAVDAATPPGKYKLLLEVRYCIFPARCIPITGESGEFEISKPSVSAQLNLVQQLLTRIYEQTGTELPVANVAPQAQTESAQSQNIDQTIQQESSTETPIPQTQADEPSLIPSALNRVSETLDNVIKGVLNVIR